MNTFWRISSYPDLSGRGGEFRTGRWHTAERGKPVVYMAEHPAVALVETLVNLKIDPAKGLPETFQLLKIEADDHLSMEEIAQETLPENWQLEHRYTRILGNDWLERGQSALLMVPSAASPESTNYLLNPRHPQAERVVVAWARWLRYDRRLFLVSETA
jgi:RES domain-containing protein